MILAEHPLAYLKGLLVKAALPRRIVPWPSRFGGDVVVARRRVGMVLAEHPFAYLKGLLVKRLWPRRIVPGH